MVLTVAVTGGIGAGKSTLARRWAERGAVLIDSDRLAREVVAVGTPGLAEVVASFGSGVLAADGALDRAALAAIVFVDQAARRRLEAITHPRIRARFAALRDAAAPDAIVVNDIPLLVDPLVAAGFHLVTGVHAAAEVRVHRLTARGLSEPDARARIAAQLPDERRRPLCDIWLDNTDDADVLRSRADRLFDERLVPFRDNLLAGRPAVAPVFSDRASVGRAGGLPGGPDPGRSDRVAMLARRVSKAVGGAPVTPLANETDIDIDIDIDTDTDTDIVGSGPIGLTVTAPDLDTATSWSGSLRTGGFPPVTGASAGRADRGDFSPSGTVFRYGSADPGVTLDLYVRLAQS